MCYGKTRTPEYIAKFPSNLAPGLEHDGVCLTEGLAIMRYLAKAFPDKAGKFYSTDAAKAAKADMVGEYITASIYPLIAKSMYPIVGFPMGAGDVGAMDSTKDKTQESQDAAAAELLNLLNTKVCDIFLKDTPYLMSDEPTIADFKFAPLLLFARIGAKLPAKLEAYMAKMEEIPGYKDAMEYGGHGPKPFTEDKKK